MSDINCPECGHDINDANRDEVFTDHCRAEGCICTLTPYDIARALLTDECAEADRLREALTGSPEKSKRLKSLVSSAVHLVAIERDDARAEAERLRTLLAAEPTEAEVEAAQWLVDSKHQFQGDTCLCGFRSPVSRQRTEHITGALRAALRAARSAR